MSLPHGYQIVTWADQSIDVRDRLEMLVNTGTQGLLIVFVILSLFLNLKIAFWVALGIPFCMLGAGGLMFLTDQTLNMLSMFAFLMAIGIVVDDAIVVSDNIERHRRLGKKLVTAAIDGTAEVAPSVVSSVTTTVITFLPLCFVSGVMGKFIAVMPFAFITALIMSLGESLLILPGHLSHEKGLVFTVLGWLLFPFRVFLPVLTWLQKGCDRSLEWVVQTCYRPLLDLALANRLSTMAVAVSVLMMAVSLVRSGVTPFSLFPKIDANRLLAKVTFPDGTPSTVTDEATRRIEQAAFQTGQKLSSSGDSIVRLVHRSVGQVAARVKSVQMLGSVEVM